MSVVLKNFARTTLAATVGVSDTVITVVDASVFGDLPTAQSYFYAALQHPTSRAIEIVKVTAVSNSQNQLTIVRAQEGTVALPFPDNALCEQRVTAATLEEKFIEAQGNQTIEGSLFVKFPYVFGVEGQDGTKYPLLQIDADDDVLVGTLNYRLGLGALNGEIWAVGEVGNPSKQWRIFHQGFLPTWENVTGDEYLDNSVDGETKTARQNLRVGSSINSALLPGTDATGDGAWSTIGKQTAWFAEGWFRDLYADNVSINDAPTDDKHAVNKAYLESNAARWKQYARGEAEMKAMREANKALYAASGAINFGKHVADSNSFTPINAGLYTNDGAPFYSQAGSLLMGELGSTKVGASVTDYPLLHAGGFETKLLGATSAVGANSFQIKFDSAPDGRDTFNKSTGAQVRHATAQAAFAAAAADPNVEVVIDRHDMFGGEFFLEIVSQANPFVYPGGDIQSKATSMNGIATSRSNRPSTYYAQYEGDTTSDGLGVDFWAATPEQKIAMLSDPANNLFLIKDEFGVDIVVQWRVRGRTLSGEGNGAWWNIDPEQLSGNGALRYSNISVGTNAGYVLAQGQRDSIPAFGDGTTNDYYPSNSNAIGDVPIELGMFRNRGRSKETAVFNLCYFMVWGTVRRLNQGAFHPSHNPLGARTCNGNTTQAVGHYWWHSSALTPRNTEECFNIVNAATDTTTHGAAEQSGYAGTTLFGRPDIRLYNIIYASGDGGVNDNRVTAWDMGSHDEAAKIFEKLLNGTYQGEEETVITKVFGGVTPTDKGTFTGYAQVRFPAGTLDSDFPQYQAATGLEDAGHFVDASGNVFVISSTSVNSGGFDTIYFNTAFGTHSDQIDIAGACYVLPIMKSGSKVYGEFTVNNVFGKPDKLMQTPDLAKGWEGYWIPSVNNENVPSNNVMLYRKATSTASYRRTYSDNAGGTWLSDAGVGIDAALNVIFVGGITNPDRVGIVSYRAFAKQTKLALIKAVLNAENGMGQVWGIQSYNPIYGCLLAESVLGKVCTSNASGHAARPLGEPYDYYFAGDGSGKLGTYYTNVPMHESIKMPAPSNKSPAVKILWHQASDNQQCTLGLNISELVHSDMGALNPVDSGSPQTYSQGGLYRVAVGNQHLGAVVQCTSTVTLQLDQYSRGEDGRFYRNSDGALLEQLKLWDGSGWGDNKRVRLFNNASTLTNGNGDVHLVATHELSKKFGYTKNRARAGVQVPGVDL